MALLERDVQLTALHRAAADAAAGRGRLVLVTGEAGIGKTSLVEGFAQEASANARILWGACESLFTPRPLGPFYDIVHALGGPLLTQLKADAKHIDLFHNLIDALRAHEEVTILVIEDVHWADHATLDFIRLAGRRIHKARAVLVLTYRDDEVGTDHPLTAILGELPFDGRLRLRLPALSSATVERLASDAGQVALGLYEATGGNPFFVTELLREGGSGVTPSVREAVMSRARRLSESAREMLDLIAVVPDRIDLSLLEAICVGDLSALDECVARGLLQVIGHAVAFRHELARRAIEDALPDGKRMRLNRMMVAELARNATDPGAITRLAHHAIAAKEPAAVLTYVSPAAAFATAKGAHREAEALLTALLPYSDRMPLQERALFFERRSQACFLVNHGAESVTMSEAAFAIWKSQHDAQAMGRNLVRRSDMLWISHPRRLEMLRAILPEAIALLEQQPASPELALAYAAKAVLIAWDDQLMAAALRDEATRRAKAHGDASMLVEVLDRTALSEQMSYGLTTTPKIDELLELAVSTDNDRGVLAAYHYRGLRSLRCRDLSGLASAVEAGLQFANERQLDQFFRGQYLKMMATDLASARGDWTGLERDLNRTFERSGVSEGLVVPLLARSTTLAARIRLDADAGPLRAALQVDGRALPNDLSMGHLANAEVAWIKCEFDEAKRSARIAWRIASRWTAPWRRGDAAFWLWVFDELGEIPANIAEPYQLQFEGRWRAAAQAWSSLGYVYEAGLALMFGDESGQRESLEIFDRLGAKAVAARCRERMRDQGIRNISRGPTMVTRGNPSGLTGRELEMLELLALGLTNREISGRIHRAVRTVDSHVAAVMEKMGARSRHEAVGLARERGWLVDRDVEQVVHVPRKK